MGEGTVYDSFKTDVIMDEIGKCESIEELKELITLKLEKQKEQWKIKINNIVARSGLTQEKFAEKCGVTRITLRDWLNKGAIPRKRELFLKIGMAAKYDQEQMNELLTRYGGYSGLYSKNLEDCIAIFVINRNYGDEAAEKYRYILDEFTRRYSPKQGENEELMSTARFDEKLSDVRDMDALERFISENLPVFTQNYYRFYAYIMSFLESNNMISSANIASLALNQEWSSSLRSSVSEIRQKKWIPNRNKVLSLGIHFGFNHEQMDEMLEVAHMGPLYSKNVFESVIIYILESAVVLCEKEFQAIEDSTDYLLNYTRYVMEQLDIPEVKQFITELPGGMEDEEYTDCD